MNEGKRSQKTPSTPSRVTQGKTWRSLVSERKEKRIWSVKFKKKTEKKNSQESPATLALFIHYRSIVGATQGKPKSDTVDFHCSKLPVICGEAKGILYKKKMKHGSSVKCIQNEDGTWLTLKEFEMEGKGRNTKNWNRSIRCGGTTLGELLKHFQTAQSMVHLSAVRPQQALPVLRTTSLRDPRTQHKAPLSNTQEIITRMKS
ncbi:hypothetical protein H8959_004848 [Pygathrix nigripes]